MTLSQKLALKRLLKVLGYSVISVIVTTLANNINVISDLVPAKYQVIIVPVLTSLLMSIEKYSKEKKK